MTETPMQVPGIRMSRLNPGHIPGLLGLMNQEGWYYYDGHELERYLALDQVCFALVTKNRVIGSIFTTNFGNQTWIGNIIVARDFRGKGLASAMLDRVIHHPDPGSGGIFRLGSVPLAIGLYKKAGFRPEGFTTAQEADLPIRIEPGALNPHWEIETMEKGDLGAVAELDCRYFKSDRSRLLSALFKDALKESCLCLTERGRLLGYLMIRRRKASKSRAGFAHGPDHAYRLGPACIRPESGIKGFKALFQKAIGPVNREAGELGGSARIYGVFPKNARREEIYKETRDLAKAMEMDAGPDLDAIFDDHDAIFRAESSAKNEEQWRYMKDLGFHQEYFEQIMSYSPESCGRHRNLSKGAEETLADTRGIFASATPGDKA